MRITTRDIEDYNDRMLTIFEQTTPRNRQIVAKWRADAQNRMISEMSFIEKRASSCPVGNLDSIISNTSYKKMKTILDKEFYNPEVMEAASCAIYSVFFGLPNNRGNTSHMELAKKYVSNLHKIGGESVSGYALTGDIKDAKDMFVIKVPRHLSGSSDLYHELFVGLFGTNHLRKFIPNFAFVYGGFRCGRPHINPKTNEVLDWCSYSEHQIPYILLESITPSIDFATYLKDCSPSQFLSGYLQALFSTKIASEKIGFTHYDLHTGNCLMRDISSMKIGNQFSIPYKTDHSSITYITADRVLTYIDYGQSYTEYNNAGYGSDQINLYENGVLNETWPLFDAYKLLMFAGDDAITAGNKEILTDMRKIFTFFNDSEKFEHCVKSQRQFYYGLPKLPGRDQTIDDLIAHVIKSCDAFRRGVVSIDEPLYNVLECSNCYTFKATLKETGKLITSQQPRSFVEMLDVAHDLKDTTNNEYDNMVKSFNYENAKAQYLEEVTKRLNKLTTFLKEPPVDIVGMQLDDPKTLEKAMRFHHNLVDSVNVFESLLTDYKSGKSLANLYQDDELDDYVDNLKYQMITQHDQLWELARQANNNYGVIHRELKDPKFIEFLKTHRKFIWYSNSASDVVGLLERLQRDIESFFEIVRLPAVIVKNRQTKNTTRLYPRNRRMMPSYDKHDNIIGIKIF